MDYSEAERAPSGGAADRPAGGRRVTIWLLAAILTILAGWALRAAAPVVIPFFAALFIALAVAPVDIGVARHMPRHFKWVGHAVAMTVVLVILVAFFAAVYLAATQAADQLPNLTDELHDALPADAALAAVDATTSPDSAGESAPASAAGPASGSDAENGGIFGLGIDLDATALLHRTVAYLSQHATAYGSFILSTVTGLITGLALVFFLALLMLVDGPAWRDKVKTAWSKKGETDWEDAFAVMASSFRWFIIMNVVLGAITATLYVAWLGTFGIGLLIVWWVITFLMAFIPTLGSVIAGLLPILYTIVTRDWMTALYVGIGIVVIEQVMGNYVSPRLLGQKLSVSPIVTFMALLFFAWMWGVMGAILAVPAAVFIVITAAHVPALRPLALLLSNQRTMEGLSKQTSR